MPTSAERFCSRFDLCRSARPTNALSAYDRRESDTKRMPLAQPGICPKGRARPYGRAELHGFVVSFRFALH